MTPILDPELSSTSLAAQWGDSVRYWLNGIAFWLLLRESHHASQCESEAIRCARLAGHYGRLALKGR